MIGIVTFCGLAIIGGLLFTVGAGLVFGPGWALISAGVLFLGGAALARKSLSPNG